MFGAGSMLASPTPRALQSRVNRCTGSCMSNDPAFMRRIDDASSAALATSEQRLQPSDTSHSMTGEFRHEIRSNGRRPASSKSTFMPPSKISPRLKRNSRARPEISA